MGLVKMIYCLSVRVEDSLLEFGLKGLMLILPNVIVLNKYNNQIYFWEHELNRNVILSMSFRHMAKT